MDPESGNPPPTERNTQIGSHPDNPPSLTPPRLEKSIDTPPTNKLEELAKARATISAEEQKTAKANAEYGQTGEPEANEETPNLPKRNNSIVGNNPYPHISPLRAEARDNTSLVRKEEDFQPADFGTGYLHGQQLGSNYGLLKEGYNAYDNDRYWKSIIKAVKKYVQPGPRTRVLEVGCAAGHLVKRLLKAGVGETIGIDISPTSLEEAKRNVPQARFEEFNLNTDSFNEALSGTFDAITALDVLEHTAHRIGPDGNEVSGPEHVIPKLVALLKDDGIFIMSAPVRDRNPISWLFNLIDGDKSHVSKLPGAKYLEILKANNLEVLEKRYSFLLPWFKIPFLPTALEVVCKKK